MHHSDVCLEFRVLKVLEILHDLLRLQHTLIRDGGAGQRAEIIVLVTVCSLACQRGLAADHEQHRVEGLSLQVIRRANEKLLHVGFASGSSRPKTQVVVGPGRELAPSQHLLAMFYNHLVNDLLRLCSLGLVLLKIKDACCIPSLLREGDACLGGGLPQELVGHTAQDTSTITRLGFAAASPSMGKVIENMQGIDNGPAARLSCEIRYESNSASITFLVRVVQALSRCLLIEMDGHLRRASCLSLERSSIYRF
mmetsp:Transcript_5398/g.10859  ORF Transcript_5398/g.10859 Transcript_5398/m.10859 type:complete len:253 (+) Transcript_5398:2464-3222(+)